MARTPWNEKEIRATIRAYFGLLDAQQIGKAPTKSEIYAKLSKNFPRRSAKAFELKFQNISAILYEESLPFADGLKPRSNYQTLLKLLVLDYLNRSQRPARTPKDILVGKIQTLWDRGYLKVTETGSGRYGKFGLLDLLI